MRADGCSEDSILGLGLVILFGVAFDATQIAFREPTSTEKAEGALEAAAKTTPKAFERPEYRLPQGAVAQSLRENELRVEDGAQFPDAFSNEMGLIGAMLSEVTAYKSGGDLKSSSYTMIDIDRSST